MSTYQCPVCFDRGWVLTWDGRQEACSPCPGQGETEMCLLSRWGRDDARPYEVEVRAWIRSKARAHRDKFGPVLEPNPREMVEWLVLPLDKRTPPSVPPFQPGDGWSWLTRDLAGQGHAGPGSIGEVIEADQEWLENQPLSREEEKFLLRGREK